MNHTTTVSESSLDSILQTFEVLIDPINYMVHDIDPLLCAYPYKRKNVHRFRSFPIIEKCDSVKITFFRDNHAFSNYPFFRFALTPFYFLITVSCSSFSREKMDILRSMAIAKSPLFEQAWNLIMSHPEIRLEGKTYAGARFSAYPRKMSSFLEHRTIVFNIYDEKIEDFEIHQYVEHIRKKMNLITPLYLLLLAASEYEGTDFLQHSVFDPWNIDKPEAVALAHRNYI